MEIIGVHHVQITVRPKEVEPARHFYCDILRLCEILKPLSLRARGGFWLQVGDREVHIGIEEQKTRTRAHVAYHVQNLAAWRTRLIAHGILIKDGIPIPGYDRFEFCDPFGNRVEMIEANG